MEKNVSYEYQICNAYVTTTKKGRWKIETQTSPLVP